LSAFNVVVLPGKYKTRELTSVSFLGPILEKTALEIILVNKPVAVTTSYQRGLKYRHSFDKEAKIYLRGEVRDGAKEHISAHSENKIDKLLGMAFSEDKEIPNITGERSPQHVRMKSSGEIIGPIAEREVIYKPRKPQLPSWVTSSVPFTLELEFLVSAQGEVKKVVPVVSSGDPEVDLLGVRYLKSWKFVPLAQGFDGEQSGRIKLTFKTEGKGW
jgi:TonB family protein